MKPTLVLQKIAAHINLLNIRPRCPRRPFQARFILGGYSKAPTKQALIVSCNKLPGTISLVVEDGIAQSAKAAVNELVQAGFISEVALSPTITARYTDETDPFGPETEILSFPTSNITDAQIATMGNMLAKLVHPCYTSGLNGLEIPVVLPLLPNKKTKALGFLQDLANSAQRMTEKFGISHPTRKASAAIKQGKRTLASAKAK